MRRVQYKRASAVTPGKHGPMDWRVDFGGKAPKHSEVVFMLGMLFMAEDRYPKLGRYMLWHFCDLVFQAKTPERVLEIAQDCEDSKTTGLEAA